MTRPSFQFYPGDWQANSNLRRCTHAEKGAWIDVMCLLHDAQEYGVLRWPLKEISQAIGAPLSMLKAIVSKGVLKGADKGETCAAFIYVPRSGRRDGEPVTLIAEQEGPIWYSSRMVKDEYVRSVRGESSRFQSESDDAPKAAPTPPLGDSTKASPKPPLGDGSSSSSSSSSSIKTISSPRGDSGSSKGSLEFGRFWDAWPSTGRKVAKAKCLERWQRSKLDDVADRIVEHVDAMKATKQWLEGFEPAPLTYLNQRRWEDELPLGVDAANGHAFDPWAPVS
ncbi:hypothetical protein [Burkholderia seminalis]|uniref:hypothetical protein n=1 Tax=Burkholderia seminalis TaxID=488731 RepID=UPI001FC84352|nr:hypothetical protein [Burkholderia seminalis]